MQSQQSRIVEFIGNNGYPPGADARLKSVRAMKAHAGAKSILFGRNASDAAKKRHERVIANAVMTWYGYGLREVLPAICGILHSIETLEQPKILIGDSLFVLHGGVPGSGRGGGGVGILVPFGFSGGGVFFHFGILHP